MRNSLWWYEESEAFDLEKIIFDIAASSPIAMKINSFQTFYTHSDPCVDFILNTWARIEMRIWKLHMSESNKNKELSESKIFISGKSKDKWEHKKLALYGWYDPYDTDKIWEDAQKEQKYQ